MMVIVIDGVQADITLENEKTLAEVMFALDVWLSGTGLTVSAFALDKKPVSGSMVAAALETEVAAIQELRITTSPVALICLEALSLAKGMLGVWRKAPPEDKKLLARDWEESPGASFLREKEKDIYGQIRDELAGKSACDIVAIIDERSREINTPDAELASLEKPVQEISGRLENFALDIQMGNDRSAAQTMEIFSKIAVKLLRLIPLLRFKGIDFSTMGLETGFFEEFNTTLKDFFTAYEASDMVMAGDLAEYEIAPRLVNFYAAIKTK